MGLSGDEAIMAAFDENIKDLSPGQRKLISLISSVRQVFSRRGIKWANRAFHGMPAHTSFGPGPFEAHKRLE
jgi:hypothetical protein